MKLTPIVRYYYGGTNNKRIDISAIDDMKWSTDFQSVGNDFEFSFIAKQKILESASVGIQIDFDNWSKENYVLMPAAAYNGNRFETYKQEYPPLIRDKSVFRVDMPVYQNDVPRLNIDPGNSKIQQLAGDMSVPCIGIFFPKEKKSLFVFGTQQVNSWETGYEIEESLDRKSAKLTVMAPGVRNGFIYRFFNFSTPSHDKPAQFQKCDKVILPLGIYYDECLNIEEFYELFVNYREKYHKNEIVNGLPLSVSFDKIKDKYNKWNWFKPKKYYKAGICKEEPSDKEWDGGAINGINNAWQTGWTGGGMVTESFLIDGDKETQNRAAENLSFIFNELLSQANFIYGAFDGNNPVSDCFGEAHPYNMMLIRKDADLLYFIMKQLPILESLGYEVDYKENIKKFANAFCNLWYKYGQFGQFIDVETGDILIGNSLSGSTAIGGLALAYEYFKCEEYKAVACEACDYYYKNYTQKGITNGGPGEIFGACDSESAGGILESYITMYNVFGDEKYIKYAKSAANQLLSWVMNYDFIFPKETLFDVWNIKTSGSCFANVQNKHSAPGFCTLSGDSLLELYRITRNEIYLNVIRDTAHNISQYLITEERQKQAPKTVSMVTDTMNERVETSDWAEPVGEIFDGSCWCEASDCLTYTEVPGLYIDKENKVICPIDHIEIISNDFKNVEIKNPTKYDMVLKVFIENGNHRVNYIKDFKKYNIKSGDTIIINL